MIVSCVGVTLGYNLCAGLLRAVGDSLTALYFLIFSALVNIVLDLFFITQLHLGVQSAGFSNYYFSRDFRQFSVFTILRKSDLPSTKQVRLLSLIQVFIWTFWTRNGHGTHEFHCFYWDCDLTVCH